MERVRRGLRTSHSGVSFTSNRCAKIFGFSVGNTPLDQTSNKLNINNINIGFV